MRSQWICQACNRDLRRTIRQLCRRRFSSAAIGLQSAAETKHGDKLNYTRNIGIIAHIDAGKTTTTERMLYYSGFTRRIGDVDDGSTVTDFLPAERARGITIQSAAITFHWPPTTQATDTTAKPLNQHTINLIDTPGHADFTFEVIRSLRVLDGAICILDGVAGVEAQTEKVWRQANSYQIPRIIYVNKLDRDGAAFHRTIKEIGSRLHTWPALCEIPWWRDGRFVGVADVVNLKGLRWEPNSDGMSFTTTSLSELGSSDPSLAEELLTARIALIEVLTEHDEEIVEAFFEANEKYEEIAPDAVWKSLRKCLLSKDQAITPVFAGASFRNIGVQPLLEAVNGLLPSPKEIGDPRLSIGNRIGTMSELLNGQLLEAETPTFQKRASTANSKNQRPTLEKLSACALAFKVVSDPKRGVLVYVRVYSGSISRNALLYNTNLATSERSPRLLRMYASEAVEIESIDEGQIGVITGLKYARTGDTLIVYAGTSAKNPPPNPINTLQLQPIEVPPPVFFTSIEPNSLSEEKNLQDTMALLLREDPSLHVSVDTESGQTHLSGMGELHLEIAQGRLIDDLKVKATIGKIQIGYREILQAHTADITAKFDRDIAGRRSEASSTASIGPVEETGTSAISSEFVYEASLHDNNRLTVRHPMVSSIFGKAPSSDHTPLPADLPLPTVLQALTTGVNAALARGPIHHFAMHSTHVTLTFDPEHHLTPTTTAAAIASAARMAVQGAMDVSAAATPTAMMEPVMFVTVTVNEEALGSVVHDLSSARGGQVLSLDAEEEEDTENGHDTLSFPSMDTRHQPERLSSDQLKRIYAPPDPFGSGLGDSTTSMQGQQRQIRARVPLKDIVGYLKHLRSLTGGRGTFIMSVDRFEKMTSQRVKNALAEMSGDLG